MSIAWGTDGPVLKNDRLDPRAFRQYAAPCRNATGRLPARWRGACHHAQVFSHTHPIMSVIADMAALQLNHERVTVRLQVQTHVYAHVSAHVRAHFYAHIHAHV